MDKNSNAYTFIFAIVMVLIVALVLSFAATSLADRQNVNHRAEKMQSILNSIGIDSVMKEGQKVYMTRNMASDYYDKFITKQLTLRSDGSVDESVNAFDVDLAQELKKPVDKQVFPLYIANVKGKKYYIIPLRGFGLWDAIWGYISLEDDVDTVKGAIFDHKGETAGLGAEITKDWFANSFKNEQVLDKNGNVVGISVVKGYNGGNNKEDHAVDAISGATLTGNGVTNMIHERLKHYVPYFQENTDVKIQLPSK